MVKGQGVLGRYISDNRLLLIAGGIAILAGSAAGSIYFLSAANAEEAATALSSVLESYNAKDAFFASVISAAEIWVIVWLCAVSRISAMLSYGALLYKSFTGAYTSAAMITVYSWKGFFAVCAQSFVYATLMLSAILVMCAGAVNLSFENAKLTDKITCRKNFAAYTVFAATVFAFMVLSCALEGYVLRAFAQRIIF